MSTQNNLIDNGSTSGKGVEFLRGVYAFASVGTFGGTTVTLERKMADDSWLSVGSDVELTAPGQAKATIPTGTYRAGVSGGSPSGLFASLDAIG